MDGKLLNDAVLRVRFVTYTYIQVCTNPFFQNSSMELVEVNIYRKEGKKHIPSHKTKKRRKRQRCDNSKRRVILHNIPLPFGAHINQHSVNNVMNHSSIIFISPLSPHFVSILLLLVFAQWIFCLYIRDLLMAQFYLFVFCVQPSF